MKPLSLRTFCLLPIIRMVFVCFLLFVFLCTGTGLAVPAYPVQDVYRDEVFIINGSRYEAMTVCEGISEGDWVVFIHGSPYGDCSSAVIHDLDSGAMCHLWCE